MSLISFFPVCTHNVGSIFRTCEGFGVERLILSGYTPYPDLALQKNAPSCAYIDGEKTRDDPRLPHIREKITSQIHKTALGATETVAWEHAESVLDVIQKLKSENIDAATGEKDGSE